MDNLLLVISAHNLGKEDTPCHPGPCRGARGSRMKQQRLWMADLVVTGLRGARGFLQKDAAGFLE